MKFQIPNLLRTDRHVLVFQMGCPGDALVEVLLNLLVVADMVTKLQRVGGLVVGPRGCVDPARLNIRADACVLETGPRLAVALPRVGARVAPDVQEVDLAL